MGIILTTPATIELAELIQEGSNCPRHEIIHEDCAGCDSYMKRMTSAIETAYAELGYTKCRTCRAAVRKRGKYKRTYCSPECYRKGLREEMGKYNVTLVCKMCGESYQRRRWVVVTRGSGYCSKACHRKALFKNYQD